MKNRNPKRKSLLQRFVYRYRLTVVNEDEQRQVFVMRVSHILLTAAVLAIAAMSAWLGITLYRNSPEQKGATYRDNLLRQTVIDEAIRLDSLEHIVDLQNRYVSNIQAIMAGDVSLDTVFSVDSLTRQRSVGLMEQTRNEEEFVRQYEEAERYNITSQSQPLQAAVQTLTLFRPTAGLVVNSFNTMDSHLGVDIAASPNQSVVAVTDGTVLFATYTSDMGYTICIVHPGELISVYKHCDSLLKSAGDKVRQGDVVALVGRASSELSDHAHLHFELWYQRQPLDPERYILFQ